MSNTNVKKAHQTKTNCKADGLLCTQDAQLLREVDSGGLSDAE